eukprot:1160112-Pelagomonas_calceolata.AAC.9
MGHTNPNMVLLVGKCLSQKCWTSELIAACMGLDRCNVFTHRVRSGQPIVMRELVVDLRKRLRGVWNAEALAEHGKHTNKLAKYHQWMALPLRPLSVHGAPFSVPRYLHLDLGKHVLRNIARFRLHAHTLKCHVPLFLRSCALYYSQASSENLEQLEQTEQPNHLAEGQTPL